MIRASQPVVATYDARSDLYVIVDTFHRCFIMQTHRDIYDACGGCLPVVVLGKGITDRFFEGGRLIGGDGATPLHLDADRSIAGQQ